MNDNDVEHLARKPLTSMSALCEDHPLFTTSIPQPLRRLR